MSDSFRIKLVEFINAKIAESGKSLPDGDLNNDTPLISSGLLESLHLLELAVLLEDETGTSLDLTSMDFVKEWDTINSIIGYLNTRK